MDETAQVLHSHPPPDLFTLAIGLCIGIAIGLLIARLIDTWAAIKNNADG